MDFTKNFVRSKNPCTEGFRWYLRNHRNGSDYQQVLDDLVRDGRTDDACWLLDQFGPTNAVLALEELECDAIVYAGSLEVRRRIDVGSVLRVGGSIRCAGSVRTGMHAIAGEDIRAAGGLNCAGDLSCAGSLLADWHVTVGGRMQCGDVKAGAGVRCSGSMNVAGVVFAKGDLQVGADCTVKALSVRGGVDIAGSLRASHGVICGEGIRCGRHIDAGSGIKAGGGIAAGAAIRAGESIECAHALRAGEGYGVFAGLGVQQQEWQTSGRVSARCRPARLMSGFWAAPHPGRAPDAQEAEGAH
jgi:hypothetical protein